MVLDDVTFTASPLKEVNGVAVRALSVLVANSNQSASKNLSDNPSLTNTLILRLYEAALSPNHQDVISAVKRMQRHDASVYDIISVIVPGVARLLGQDWIEDSATFGAVTIGSARLQACVHHLERSFAERPLIEKTHPTNCLVVTPEGAQHTLGAVVLAAELRQAGPHVQLSLDVNAERIAHLVAADTYDVVMISAALGQDTETLRALVKAIRLKKPIPRVIIGGSLLNHEANLKKITGADDVTSVWQNVVELGSQGLRSKETSR